MNANKTKQTKQMGYLLHHSGGHVFTLVCLLFIAQFVCNSNCSNCQGQNLSKDSSGQKNLLLLQLFLDFLHLPAFLLWLWELYMHLYS